MTQHAGSQSWRKSYVQRSLPLIVCLAGTPALVDLLGRPHPTAAEQQVIWGLAVLWLLSLAALLWLTLRGLGRPALEVTPAELRTWDAAAREPRRIAVSDVRRVEIENADEVLLRLASGGVERVSLRDIARRQRDAATAAIKRTISAAG